MADLRDRCVILIMSSGGIRAGAIPELKVKHQSILNKNNGIGLLKVYPESKRHSYITLLTPECMYLPYLPIWSGANNMEKKFQMKAR